MYFLGYKQKVALWIGFGLFLLTYGGGPLGFFSGPSGQELSWGAIVAIHAAFYFGTAVGCLGVRTLARKGNGFTKRTSLFFALGYVGAVLFGLIVQPLLATVGAQAELGIRFALSLVLGMFYAYPLLFWVESLLELRQTRKRHDLVAALVPCYIVSPIVTSLVSPLSQVLYAYSFCAFACALVSVAIQVSLSVRPNRVILSSGNALEDYRLSVYSISVLGCLGFTWGIAQAACIVALDGGASQWLLLNFVMTIVSVLALAAAMLFGSTGGEMKFGAFVRIVIVASGAIIAATPLILAFFPLLLYSLCVLVMLAGEIALITFSTDICCKEGKPLVVVYAKNYLVFVGFICVASVFFLVVHTVADSQTAWQMTALVSTWVVLAIIPLLPSRSSDAVVFTLKALPENEGYETNVSLKRDRMVQKYSLSKGESVVLELLLQGMNRSQIAEEMYLSPWTIKARISAIYRKCGVHSYKELIKLVSDDDS